MRRNRTIALFASVGFTLTACSGHPESEHPQYLSNTAAVEHITADGSISAYTEEELFRVQEELCPLLENEEYEYQEMSHRLSATLSDIPKWRLSEPVIEAAGRSQCPSAWEKKKMEEEERDAKIVDTCETLIAGHLRVREEPPLELTINNAIGGKEERVWSLEGEVSGMDGGRMTSDIPVLCYFSEEDDSAQAYVGRAEIMEGRLKMMGIMK